MPVFIILVLLGATLLWLLLSFAFIPLGKFVYRLWRDAKDAMEEEVREETTNSEKGVK